MTKPLRALALSLALLTPAVAFAACGSSSDETDAGAQDVAVTITDDGCDPASIKAKPGETTFTASNENSDVNNEFEILDGDTVVGERENITPGLSGEVSVDLEPGAYDIACGNPGDPGPMGRLLVAAK